MEARQDSSLRVGVEVHQRVAADEDVDAGDGWVLHQIVPPEDHGAAKGPIVEVVARRQVTEKAAGESVPGAGGIEHRFQRIGRRSEDAAEARSADDAGGRYGCTSRKSRCRRFTAPGSGDDDL